MPLTQNTPRSFETGDINDLAVAASSIVYEGAAVGIVAANGLARGLVAGDQFAGFADRECDNRLGAASAARVRVREDGKAQLAIAGLAATDVQKRVYASADGTFTLTVGTNSLIGHVHRFVSTGVGIVKFAAQPIPAE
ncbi:MAG: hypothetical protein ACKVK5_10650 [Pseudomonadales bacterium]